ncbi:MULTISPECIES: hypothetical protein [Paraburkholderia]|uniref:hypothetical protein n=1 Tax=Paraburkholderia TaxID=1822464 RepID=UPI000370A754|nr:MULTISPECIES: hypothetical protein [Paraburkholderia]MDH6147276.1 hypothetical protein [Paraburkholderia sp. WSM4179]
MSKPDLPTGLLARKQRSGRTFFYLRISPDEKEVPLGGEQAVALARYQVIQRDRFLTTTKGGDIRALDLISQFKRCSTPPTDRHGQSRRKFELKALVDFFTETRNPTIDSIPAKHRFEQWVLRRDEVRNLDSVGLFRRIWGFFFKNGYIVLQCPWAVTGQHGERVTLELSDILYPYSETPLREILQVLLRQSSDPSTLFKGEDLDAQKDFSYALLRAKDAACRDLEQSLRNDLIPALHNLTGAMLSDAILSATRVKNLPPGKINLTNQTRSIISSARQLVSSGNSKSEIDT